MGQYNNVLDNDASLVRRGTELGNSYGDQSGYMDSLGYGNIGVDGGGEGGLFSSLTGTDIIDGISGFGQLGLGLFNYLDNKPVKKAQIRGLNEQIDSSQYARGAHKDFVSGSRNAFA